MPRSSLLWTLSSMFLISWILSLTWRRGPTGNPGESSRPAEQQLLQQSTYNNHQNCHDTMELPPCSRATSRYGITSLLSGEPTTAGHTNPFTAMTPGTGSCTLAPPRMAHTGRTGASKTLAKASSSSETPQGKGATDVGQVILKMACKP